MYKSARLILIITYLSVCLLAIFKIFNIPFINQTLIVAIILMALQTIVIAKHYNKALAEVELVNENLEKTVIKRTAELIQNEKETMNLILSISHDLRTPIAVVSGYMELLQNDPTLNNDYKKYISNSTVRLSQMERLTYDLFTLSQLKDKNYVLQLEKVNMDEEIRQIANLYEKQAQQKNIIFHVITTPAECIADRVRIMQVLDNLLINALAYARTMIRLSMETNDTEVKITVTDDGQGINQEELAYVFDRFYKKRKRGSGIGLSNVKELVLRMNGKVFVESEPFVSTRFIFTLQRIENKSKTEFASSYEKDGLRPPSL